MTARTDRDRAIRINSLLPHTQFTSDSMRGLMEEAIKHFRPEFSAKGKSDAYLRGSVDMLLDAHDAINNGGRIDEDHPLVQQIRHNRKRLAGVS